MTPPPRALTIKLPWAWQRVTLTDPVEHRAWPTRHRGKLYIHSAIEDDPAATLEHWDDAARACPRGHILGWVTLLDVVRNGDERWRWLLGEPHLVYVTPLPARGLPGVWDLPPNLRGLS